MPSLNFSKFVDKVENGSKPFTIRKKRKRPIKVGDPLFLYTGLRTSKCRQLETPNDPTFCQGIYPVMISKEGAMYFTPEGRDKILLTHATTEAIAKVDGFDSLADFLSFFTNNGTEDFEGNIILFSFAFGIDNLYDDYVQYGGSNDDGVWHLVELSSVDGKHALIELALFSGTWDECRLRWRAGQTYISDKNAFSFRLPWQNLINGEAFTG